MGVRFWEGAPGRVEERLLEAARSEPGPVTWVTLPPQRRYYLWRLAAAGPRLGLEVTQTQQLYHRVVTAFPDARPVLGRAGRVALVAAVLAEEAQARPSAGEAVLFTRAIAELKRHGLTPKTLPDCGDAETERLRRVFARYEAIKEDRGVWDADDVRDQAIRRVEEGKFRTGGAVYVGGFLELSPMTLRFFKALAEAGDRVTIARPGPEQKAPEVKRFEAQNPVHEFRWALYSLQQDVHERGIPPEELAVVVPRAKARAFELLAREYEVHLAPEYPVPLGELTLGRGALLAAEFPHHPRPEALLRLAGALPEPDREALSQLARRAMSRGVAGWEALFRLAEEEAPRRALEALRAHFQVGPDYAERVLKALEEEDDPYAPVVLGLWREALEATASPEEALPWWASLLRAQSVMRPVKAGIALLTPEQAVGRRYRKAYVLSASEGTYRLNEREDYFFPEECRRGRLTPRLKGNDRWLWDGLLHLGETTLIAYPSTEGGSFLRPEPGLFGWDPGGREIEPIEPVLFASRRVKAASAEEARHDWEDEALALPEPSTLRELRRLRRVPCGLAYALSAARLPAEREEGPLVRLLKGLEAGDPGAQAALGLDPEEARGLRFSAEVRVAFGERGFWARPHALGPDRVYEFALREKREAGWDALLAAEVLRRPVELRWKGGHVLIQGEELEKQIKKARKELADAVGRFHRLVPKPEPGWHCRDCAFRQVCREGQG